MFSFTLTLLVCIDRKGMESARVHRCLSSHRTSHIFCSYKLSIILLYLCVPLLYLLYHNIIRKTQRYFPNGKVRCCRRDFCIDESIFSRLYWRKNVTRSIVRFANTYTALYPFNRHIVQQYTRNPETTNNLVCKSFHCLSPTEPYRQHTVCVYHPSRLLLIHSEIVVSLCWNLAVSEYELNDIIECEFVTDIYATSVF